MGIHYYDTCTEPFEAQCIRLKPARVLTEAQIPCMVWAEDALSLAHFVPTALFAQHLIVPDDLIALASSTIQSGFSYTVGPANTWTEIKPFDPDKTSPFPHSIHLHSTVPAELRDEDDPPMVIIHPHSDFSLDVRDHSLSTSLVPPLPASYSAIRFPTRVAFLDSLVSMILDPPSGRKQWKFINQMIVFISYINMYTRPLREVQPYVLPSGELDPRCADVVASLREENRSYLDDYLRGRKRAWAVNVVKRRTVLERMG
ncbi:hypothetical protein F5I97DRAFT_1508751 [Phlebopus sp. FC_14]|nr:hypothetical protein F5I97DRAFT_1508751 [Phlebopus sp. FC_14]